MAHSLEHGALYRAIRHRLRRLTDAVGLHCLPVLGTLTFGSSASAQLCQIVTVGSFGCGPENLSSRPLGQPERPPNADDPGRGEQRIHSDRHPKYARGHRSVRFHLDPRGSPATSDCIRGSGLDDECNQCFDQRRSQAHCPRRRDRGRPGLADSSNGHAHGTIPARPRVVLTEQRVAHNRDRHCELDLVDDQCHPLRQSQPDRHSHRLRGFQPEQCVHRCTNPADCVDPNEQRQPQSDLGQCDNVSERV